MTLGGPAVRLEASVGIGLRKDDGCLRDRLDRATESMNNDGSLNALIRKWFGPDAAIF